MSLSFFSPQDCQAWREIRGWLLPEAAEELYRCASMADPDGLAVEVGSFSGKSTVCIARALKDSREHDRQARLVAVDIRFQPDFASNLTHFGVDNLVHKMECSSLDAVEECYRPVSFLFIDGHHGKAHAYADLVVWDMFVIPGGIVAFDDTAGFMLGPNLQLQAALRTGAYELLSDVGGVSFLRKRKSLLSDIGDFPCAEGSRVAYLDYVSAWLGAMDPSFRFPQIPEQNRNFGNTLGRRLMDTSPRQMINFISRKFGLSTKTAGLSFDFDDGVEAEAVPVSLRKPVCVLGWLKSEHRSEVSFGQTLLYLQACLDVRLDRVNGAVEKLEALSGLDQAMNFVHYHISIRDLSVLRLAQIDDLQGRRDRAKERYNFLVGECAIPELRQQAEAGLSSPYRVPAVKEKFLLRELNTGLKHYRVVHDRL